MDSGAGTGRIRRGKRGSMIFAVSSSVPGALTPAQLQAGCVASAKGLARLAAWWGIPAPRVEFTTQLGATLDDTSAYDVHILPDLSQFPGASQDLAFHIDANGRPTCYIGANVCKAENGTADWIFGPDGLWVAIDHELKECAIDPDCSQEVQGPTCKMPKEVCDLLQGTDYTEPGSDGIYLANAYGPQGFVIGATRAAGLDIASDLRAPVATEAFWLAPGGYYVNVDTDTEVFGALVSAAKIDRIKRTGVRGGLRRVKR